MNGSGALSQAISRKIAEIETWPAWEKPLGQTCNQTSKNKNDESEPASVEVDVASTRNRS